MCTPLLLSSWDQPLLRLGGCRLAQPLCTLALRQFSASATTTPLKATTTLPQLLLRSSRPVPPRWIPTSSPYSRSPTPIHQRWYVMISSAYAVGWNRAPLCCLCHLLRSTRCCLLCSRSCSYPVAIPSLFPSNMLTLSRLSRNTETQGQETRCQKGCRSKGRGRKKVDPDYSHRWRKDRWQEATKTR